MLKKNVYTFYTLAVCLIAVISVTIMAAGLAYNLLRIAMPQYTISDDVYRRYASNEKYIEELKSQNACFNDKNHCRLPTKEEEITAEREKKLAEILHQEERESVHSIIECAPYLILFLLVGFAHWRMFKTIKE